jgi:hypothetical protein
VAGRILLIQFSPCVQPDIRQIVRLPGHKEQERRFEVVLWISGLLGLLVQFAHPKNYIKEYHN